ncbi:MAG: DCC1-like thiol-disulfide oxidoreductase family protein [Thaumarchaeota archaeon]|nr:DCC1-like thiol-disulfide oxidoreductase family protein [Nitrososphaerota archaeon]
MSPRFAPESKYVLVYDSDCGPCDSFKRVVSFLEPRGNLEYLSLHEADSEGLLDEIPLRSRHASAHLVRPDGDVLSGAGAIPQLLEFLPGGFIAAKVVGGWEPARRFAGFAYGVASRLHDGRGCRSMNG